MRSACRRLALGLAVCLALTVCPLPVSAAEVQGALVIDRDARTITVQNPDRSDGDCLRKAVEAAEDGYTIIVADYGSVNVASVGASSVNDPWLIDKAVTIQGGRLELRCCGILLGADVTLRNTQLMVMSPIRNCILANGHTLVLDSVSVDTYAAQQMHIVCGAPTLGGFTESFRATVPPPGELGHIILKGTTGMGNLYAGGLYTGGSYTAGETFPSWVPARITVDPTATGRMGSVYACGALEQPAPDNWFDFPKVDPPDPRPEQCPMEAGITVELYNGVISDLQGQTGGSVNAHVVYNGGENAVENTALENIASLSVASGLFRPKVLSGEGMALGVAAGAMLRLIGTPSLPTVGTFSGGGSLVLDRDQRLDILGAVSGTTAVYAGGSSGNRSHAIAAGHTYLTAPLAAADSFALIPTNAGGESFDFDPSTGAWTARREGDDILPLVESLSLPQTVTQAANANAWSLTEEVPLTVVYTDNGADWVYQDLGMIPLTVTLGGEAMDLVCDGYYYAYYADGLTLYIVQDAISIETVAADPSVITPLPAGVYDFVLTVPADYSASGQPLTASIRLVIEAQAAQSGDYALDTPQLSELGGQALEALPADGPCVVSVPVTRTGALTRCQVLLAAYSGGRLAGIQLAEVSLPAENTAVPVVFILADAADITAVKAFALSSLTALAPIAPAAGFPLE